MTKEDLPIVVVATWLLGVLLGAVAASESWLPWITALGGWFGGLVVLPTYYLLRRQTHAGERQAAMNIIAAMRDELSQINTERDLVKRIEALAPILLIPKDRFSDWQTTMNGYSLQATREICFSIQSMSDELAKSIEMRDLDTQFDEFDDYRTAIWENMRDCSSAANQIAMELVSFGKMKAERATIEEYAPSIMSLIDDLDHIYEGKVVADWRRAVEARRKSLRALIAAEGRMLIAH